MRNVSLLVAIGVNEQGFSKRWQWRKDRRKTRRVGRISAAPERARTEGRAAIRFGQVFGADLLRFSARALAVLATEQPSGAIAVRGATKNASGGRVPVWEIAGTKWGTRR